MKGIGLRWKDWWNEVCSGSSSRFIKNHITSGKSLWYGNINRSFLRREIPHRGTSRALNRSWLLLLFLYFWCCIFFCWFICRCCCLLLLLLLIAFVVVAAALVVVCLLIETKKYVLVGENIYIIYDVYIY